MTITITTAKIKTGLSRYTNSFLAAFVHAVIIALTDNVNFPLTQPMLAGLTDNLASFNTAMANAQNRDKVMIGLRNTARMNLTVQLTTVAASVTFEAQGDRDKLLSSNFELYKNGSTPPALLGPVTGFKVLDADIPVGLKLSCDGVKGRVSYTHRITPDPLTPDSVWTSVSTTLKEYTFANLPSGKKFWGQIIATGTKEQKTMSDPLSRITQ